MLTNGRVYYALRKNNRKPYYYCCLLHTENKNIPLWRAYSYTHQSFILAVLLQSDLLPKLFVCLYTCWLGVTQCVLCQYMPIYFELGVGYKNVIENSLSLPLSGLSPKCHHQQFPYSLENENGKVLALIQSTPVSNIYSQIIHLVLCCVGAGRAPDTHRGVRWCRCDSTHSLEEEKKLLLYY